MDGSIRKTMFAKVSRGWGAIWKRLRNRLVPRLGTALGPVRPAFSLVMVVFFPLSPRGTVCVVLSVTSTCHTAKLC